MKTINKQSILILSVIALAILGCTNKNDDSVTPDSTRSNIIQGNWKVAYFNDSGKDETHKFNGYTFVFGSNGTITASNGSNTQTGTWNTGNDGSTVKLYLTFGNVSPFDELTDDWHVIEQSSTIIKLRDVSGGNGGTDYLTFEKI